MTPITHLQQPGRPTLPSQGERESRPVAVHV
jgi:hypothetical protein